MKTIKISSVTFCTRENFLLYGKIGQKFERNLSLPESSSKQVIRIRRHGHKFSSCIYAWMNNG